MTDIQRKEVLQLSIDVEALEKILRQAGELLLDKSLYKEYEVKDGTANYVTKVDYMVQAFMVEQLDRILPGSNIITEEAKVNSFNFDRPTWILDPVDGTTNLMYRYGMSAISLGLAIGKKAELGMVYNPFTNEMFIGTRGKGASLNGESVRASGRKSIGECLVGFGTTPYERSGSQRTFEIVHQVFMETREIRRSGSAALDLAYVACGRLDGFFEMTLQPWDYAAGIAILEAAGGRITDWENKNLDMTKASSVVASNGHIHEKLLALINQ